jgi:ribosomal protein L19
MKLNKKIILSHITKKLINAKFRDCNITSLKRGCYIKLNLLIHDDQPGGDVIARYRNITGIILFKKIKYNNSSLTLSTLYQNEKVLWRVVLSSPQLIWVQFLQKQTSKGITDLMKK